MIFWADWIKSWIQPNIWENGPSRPWPQGIEEWGSLLVNRIVRIELFGQAYEFKAEAKGIHAEKIADYVVQEVERAQSSANVPGKLETLILAALNIANNYFEMKERRDNLSRDIDQRCRTLIENIDANA